MDAQRVYIPLDPETLVALDRETGSTVWTRSIESAWPPVVRDGVVYIAASDEIHALDPVTGEQKWRAPFERPMTAPLTWAHGWLVTVIEPSEVVAFRPADGSIGWRKTLGAPATHRVVGDGTHLYVALGDARVVALAPQDGSVVWEQVLAGKLSEPGIARDRLFVGSDNNRLYALDPRKGKILWQWRSGGDVIGAAADSAGRVYVPSLDNMLRALNTGNGNQRWKKDIAARPAIPPLVLDDIVVLTGVSPVVTAYDGRTGTVAGSYTGPPEASIQGAPMIDPVLRPYRVAMVVVTSDGRAIGLRPTAMLFKETPLTAVDELPGARLRREVSP